MGGLWAAALDYITGLLKKERYEKPKANSWARRGSAIFGAMSVTTFACPLFIAVCFPDACSSALSFILSGAVTVHIALIVVAFCLVFPTGFSIIIGLIASVSIGDEATQYHLMMRGIKLTILVFLAIGGLVLLAVEMYHQILRLKNDGAPVRS